MTQTMTSYEVIRDERVERDGYEYHRILLRTPWFDGPLDLAKFLWSCRNERPYGGTIVVCEKLAIVATGRDVDRMYPGLAPRVAQKYANALARVVGAPVAIVNERGGRVRAISPGGLPAADLLRALRDNPMGHYDQATPIGVVSRCWPPSSLSR